VEWWDSIPSAIRRIPEHTPQSAGRWRQDNASHARHLHSWPEAPPTRFLWGYEGCDRQPSRAK